LFANDLETTHPTCTTYLPFGKNSSDDDDEAEGAEEDAAGENVWLLEDLFFDTLLELPCPAVSSL
jgi:hypothetical protein